LNTSRPSDRCAARADRSKTAIFIRQKRNWQLAGPAL